MPLESPVPRSLRVRRLIVVQHCARNQLPNEVIGSETDQHADRERECAEEKGDTPFGGVKCHGRQRTRTDLDNNQGDVDTNKEPVSVRVMPSKILNLFSRRRLLEGHQFG